MLRPRQPRCSSTSSTRQGGGVSLSLLPFHSIHSCIRAAKCDALLATSAALEIALVASEFIDTQGFRLLNRRTRFRVWREREREREREGLESHEG